MIDKSVVIAIMARDCKESLERNIPKIEQLRNNFKSSAVVVVENDSKDGTKELLKRWTADSENINLIMNDYGTVTIPPASGIGEPLSSLYRIEKMARYRNLYVDYVKKMESTPDYLIVIDIDVNFSVNGILHAIESAPSDWGGLFANGQIFWHGLFPYFFDMFAYLPYDSKSVSRTSREMFCNSKTLTRRLRKENYVGCCSAFGGVGVYRWDCVKNAEYHTSKNERSQINEALCEHISFNMAVVNSGYKNYICRDMKINYGTRTRSLKHVLIYSVMPAKMYLSLYKIIKGKDYVD